MPKDIKDLNKQRCSMSFLENSVFTDIKFCPNWSLELTPSKEKKTSTLLFTCLVAFGRVVLACNRVTQKFI